MKKKVISLILCAALLTVAVIGGTLAYFTDMDDATNTFTVGKVDIELEEPNWEGNDQTLMPGTTLPKDPTITVESDSEDCYLFVELDMTRYVPLLAAFLEDNGYEAADLQKHSVREEFTSQYLEGFVDEKWTIMNTDEILAAVATGNPTHLIIDLGYNVEGGVLEANDQVTLFTAIKMPETVDSEEARLFWAFADGTVKEENTPVTIGITAYAIQAENIDDLDAAYAALNSSDVEMDNSYSDSTN